MPLRVIVPQGALLFPLEVMSLLLGVSHSELLSGPSLVPPPNGISLCSLSISLTALILNLELASSS